MGIDVTAHQPAPLPSAGPAVWDLVVADMAERDRTGTAKHGTRLRTDNGRDFLIDAYQEALDLVVYLRGQIEEQQTALKAAGVLEDSEALLELHGLFAAAGDRKTAALIDRCHLALQWMATRLCRERPEIPF